MDFYNFILPGRKYISQLHSNNNKNIIYIPIYKKRIANLKYSIVNELESQVINSKKFKNEYDEIKSKYEASITEQSLLSNSNFFNNMSKEYPNYIKNKIESSNILRLTHINILNNLKKNSIIDPFSLNSKLFLNINEEKCIYKIPCLLINYNKDCNDIIIYFHANSECIYDVESICKSLSLYSNINVLAVEYPGYSIYNGDPTEEKLYLDSVEIYDYLKSIKINKIYTIGRSIGTGIAIYLSSKRDIEKLMLISPFLSIRNIVEDLTFFLLKYWVKERFINEERIKYIKCPILLIHGKLDTLIPIKHSISLKENYDNSKKNLGKNKSCTLIKFSKMTHNINCVDKNIVQPFLKFIKNKI